MFATDSQIIFFNKIIILICESVATFLFLL